MALLLGRPVVKAAPNPPLNAAERRLVRIIQAAMDDLRVSADSAAVQRALDTGNIENLLAAIDFPEFISSFGEVREEMAGRISYAANQYARTIGLEMSFARVDPNVVMAANTQVGHLITHIAGNTRLAVRQVVTSAIASQQMTVHDVRKVVQGIVGLTPRMARSVANARARFLSEQMARGVPLGRATELADALMARLRKRAIRSRAITIARTEISRANNTGRYLTWQEGARTGLVTALHRKEWVITAAGNRGGDACEICAPLDGMTIPWDAEFPGGFLHPPAHPRCRCTVVLRKPETTVSTDEWLRQQGWTETESGWTNQPPH